MSTLTKPRTESNSDLFQHTDSDTSAGNRIRKCIARIKTDTETYLARLEGVLDPLHDLRSQTDNILRVIEGRNNEESASYAILSRWYHLASDAEGFADTIRDLLQEIIDEETRKD